MSVYLLIGAAVVGVGAGAFYFLKGKKPKDETEQKPPEEPDVTKPESESQEESPPSEPFGTPRQSETGEEVESEDTSAIVDSGIIFSMESTTVPGKYRRIESARTMNTLKARSNIIEEFVSNERKYIELIEICHSDFYVDAKDHLNVKDVENIFTNFLSIYNVRSTFLEGLEKILKIDFTNVDEAELPFSDILLEICTILNTYTSYCANYKYTFKKIQDVKAANKKKFEKYLSDQEAKLKEKKIEPSDLYGFLVLPIYQFTVYSSLIDKILNNTPPEENEEAISKIAEADQKRKEAFEYFEERKKEILSIAILFELEKKIEFEGLYNEKRFIIKDMGKNKYIRIGSTNNKKELKYLYLLNDCFLAVDNSVVTKVLKRKSYLKHKAIMFKQTKKGYEVKVDFIKDNDSGLVISSGKDSIQIMFSDAETAGQWCEEIRNVLKEFK